MFDDDDDDDDLFRIVRSTSLKRSEMSRTGCITPRGNLSVGQLVNWPFQNRPRGSGWESGYDDETV